MSLKSNYEYIRDWCNHRFLKKSDQVKVDLSNYYTKTEVDSQLSNIDLSEYAKQDDLDSFAQYVDDNKQDVISDLETIRTNAANGAAKVSNVQSDWNASSGDAAILNKPDLSVYLTASNLSTYLTISDYQSDEEVVAASLNDLNSRIKTVEDADYASQIENAAIWESGSGTNSAVLKGNTNVASGTGSTAEGNGTTSYGNYSHAEGESTNAFGKSSHAEGRITNAGVDPNASSGVTPLLNPDTTTEGAYAHAEGQYTSAKSNSSHAEGLLTNTNGVASHVEGYWSQTNGNYSHAEGNQTMAIGESSHTEGNNTIANNANEHAEGQYNVSTQTSSTFGDPGNTISSIGIGIATARKNAIEVMQNGDVYILGIGGYDGTNASSATSLQAVISSLSAS